MKRLTTWMIRLAGFLFLAAAALQWVSYNLTDAGNPSPSAQVLGWVWTVLIAAPGVLLLAYSRNSAD